MDIQSRCSGIYVAISILLGSSGIALAIPKTVLAVWQEDLAPLLSLPFLNDEKATHTFSDESRREALENKMFGAFRG